METKQLNWCVNHKIVYDLKIKQKCTAAAHAAFQKNTSIVIQIKPKLFRNSNHKKFFLILRVIWWRIVRLRIFIYRYRLCIVKNQLVSDRPCIPCFRSSIVGDRLCIRIVRVVCQHKRCYHCIDTCIKNIDSYAVFKNVVMNLTDKTKQMFRILFSINLFTIILLNSSFAGRIDIF